MLNNYISSALSIDSQASAYLIDLTWHCTKKGFQLGSVLGFAVIFPCMFYKRRTLNSSNFAQYAKSQIYSLIFGVSFAWVGEWNKYRSWENKKECLRDRCFRLKKNEGQNRVDYITGVSFIASWLILTGLTKKPLTSVGLSTPGVVGGIVYHLVSKRTEEDEDKKESPANLSQKKGE